MIFRLSQKLARKLKISVTETLPLDEDPYADWSCHLFTAERTQYIILSNTKSLYSCVMFGKGVANESAFVVRALDTMREFMEDDGQLFAYRRFVAPSTNTVRFAKALNRSVIGSMNDLVYHAQMWLADGDVAPHEVGFRLNDIPMSALGKPRGYMRPKDAFKLLAGRRE